MAQSMTKAKSSRHFGWVVSIVVLLAIFVLFILLFKDKIIPPDAGSQDVGALSGSKPFSYENGSKQMFAIAGDRLGIVSSSGLQILDDGGELIFRQVFSMKNPTISSGGRALCFYDVGGLELRYYDGSTLHQITYELPIISVSVGWGNYFAVTSQEAGYRGSVTVYNNTADPVYKWYSGEGYPIDAAVSGDNRTLAVLCVKDTGSVVHFFKLNNEEEKASASLDGELSYKLFAFENGNFCTIGQKSIWFFGSDGRELGSFDYGDHYLLGFEPGNKSLALVLSKFVSGGQYRLVGLASSGRELGETTTDFEPLSLSFKSQRFLAFSQDKLLLLSREMRKLSETVSPPGFSDAILISRSQAYLLTSHYYEKIKLG